MEHESLIRKSNSPMIAARMEQDRKRPLRRDWESVKDRIMRDGVLAKFTQHHDLRAILLNTGDAEIGEHNVNDRYRGDGGDGSGRNILGIIMIKIREKLRNE